MHEVTAPLMASVGHGVTALWYLTRSTGLVSLILLSATVVLGIVASVGWTTERWPRFLSQSVHRNLSFFCLALIGVHVLSTVGDGYVPITVADAVIPFLSPYRPIWVGLGALAFDMLLAVALTSALRRRIGPAAWRGVHWLAYACWPIAVVHGLGSGSDPRLPGGMLVFVACLGAVVAAVAWRLTVGYVPSVAWRLGWALGGIVVLVVIAAFALAGPLQPGWANRAGTSPAVLAELAGTANTSSGTGGAAPAPSQTQTTSQKPSSGLPATPFSTYASGTVTTSRSDGEGNARVTLDMHLRDSSAPLEVQIIGPLEDGGVAMRQSSVTFGPLTGQVTALEGSTVGAVVNGPSGSINLTMQLSLDPSAGTLTGQVSGSSSG